MSEIGELRNEIKKLRSSVIDLSERLNPKWYSINEACKYLGIGRTKMYELINDSLINYALKGSRKKFTHRHLKEYIESQSIRAVG